MGKIEFYLGQSRILQGQVLADGGKSKRGGAYLEMAIVGLTTPGASGDSPRG